MRCPLPVRAALCPVRTGLEAHPRLQRLRRLPWGQEKSESITTDCQGRLRTFDRGLALRLCALYAAATMSTVTIQQFQQDLATWLGVVGHGEPVLIMEQGRVIAQLTPPDAASLPPPVKPKLSMAEWLDKQDEQMKRIFGDRIIADSSAVLNDMRGD